MNHAFILNRNRDQLITSGSPWLLGKGKLFHKKVIAGSIGNGRFASVKSLVSQFIKAGQGEPRTWPLQNLMI